MQLSCSPNTWNRLHEPSPFCPTSHGYTCTNWTCLAYTFLTSSWWSALALVPWKLSHHYKGSQNCKRARWCGKTNLHLPCYVLLQHAHHNNSNWCWRRHSNQSNDPSRFFTGCKTPCRRIFLQTFSSSMCWISLNVARLTSLESKTLDTNHPQPPAIWHPCPHNHLPMCTSSTFLLLHKSITSSRASPTSSLKPSSLIAHIETALPLHVSLSM